MLTTDATIQKRGSSPEDRSNEKTKNGLIAANSRTGQVVDHLTQRILEGDFKRNELLPAERELASQLGVSRTVIREATKMLQWSGLVNIRQGSGALVRGASSEPVERAFAHALHGEIDALSKVYEVRRALETDIVALAAKRRTDNDIQKLRALCQEMDSLASHHAEQRLRFIDLDMAFHNAIAAATQNNAFVIILQATTTLFANERKEAKVVGISDQKMQREHWRILRAIEDGEAALAVRVMRDHLKMRNRLRPSQ